MSEKNLRLRVVLDLVDKALAPLKRISQGSQDAAATLKAAREQLKQLNDAQANAGKFRETQTGLAATEQKLKAARVGLDQLKTSMNQAGVPTKALAAKFTAAQTEADKLGAKFNSQQQQLRQLETRLTAAGVDTRNLASSEQQLASRITSATADINTQTAALKRQSDEQRRLAKLQQQAAKGAAIGAGMAAAGVAGVYAGKRTVQAATRPVQSFMAHEDAMLGIARQVPGARSDAGELTAVYKAIEEQVRSLSTHVPLASTQIAEMFTAAARMEVPTDKLGEFVLMASEMATAFDAVPDEITESMGKVAKNFKIELTNIRGLADAINYLDDNAISKGSDIIDYLNRTSGVLATVAMSERNAAALGSTLLTLGERAETASTATNAIVAKFAAATKGTKKFQSAVKEIGLSSQAIETGMTKDATGTLMKVMEAVRKAPEAKRMGIMVELVGMEHADTLAKLVDKPEELQRQIDLANSKQADGSMGREASARNQTMSAQSKMFDNRLFNLKAIVGEGLKSSIQELLAVVNPLLERLTQWAQANPGLVSSILKGVIVFGALLTAASALLIPLGLLVAKGMLVRLMLAKLAGVAAGGGAFGGMATGAGRLLPLLARGALLLLRFMGPIGLLITAGWALYSNWENIAAGGKLLWSDFTTWLGSLWSGFIGWLTSLWAGIESVASSIWSSIVSTVYGLLNMGIGQWVQVLLNFSPFGLLWTAFTSALSLLGIQVPEQFRSFGGFIMDGLIGGITAKLSALKDSVVGAATSAAQWFKEKLGIASPSKVFTQFGGWISEGAANGIAAGQAGVRAAALAMAGAAAAPVGAMDSVGAGTAISSGPVIAPASSISAPAAPSSYNITIHAAPGMDTNEIARVVAAEIDKRERQKESRGRSALHDIG